MFGADLSDSLLVDTTNQFDSFVIDQQYKGKEEKQFYQVSEESLLKQPMVCGSSSI